MPVKAVNFQNQALTLIQSSTSKESNVVSKVALDASN